MAAGNGLLAGFEEFVVSDEVPVKRRRPDLSELTLDQVSVSGEESALKFPTTPLDETDAKADEVKPTQG
ncbi:hypothetical protein ACWGVR_27625 [Streptomyces xanthophaeus]